MTYIFSKISLCINYILPEIGSESYNVYSKQNGKKGREGMKLNYQMQVVPTS